MSLAPKTTIITILLVWSIHLSGQQLNDYRVSKVFSGQNLEIIVDSDRYPVILGEPQHGTTYRFKYSYEDFYRLRYEPDAGFTGVDTLVLENFAEQGSSLRSSFAGYVISVQSLVARPDYYAIRTGSIIELDILSNDLGILNGARIERILSSTGGQVKLLEAGQIQVLAAEPGVMKISYLLCQGNYCDIGQVFIRADDPNLVQSGDTLAVHGYKDETVTFAVAPGFDPPTALYYSGTLDKLSDQIFEYQPDAGFVGREVIRFSQWVDAQLIFFYVDLDFTDPLAKNVLINDDHVYTEPHTPVRFSLLENDFGSGTIDLIISDLQGDIQILNDVYLEFTPAEGFIGVTDFNYALCDKGQCDTGKVNIQVYDYRPLQTSWNYIVENHHVRHFRYNVPIDDFRFKVIEWPATGSLELSDAGKTVSYYPEAGYVGEVEMEIEYCVGRTDSEVCSSHRWQLTLVEGVGMDCSLECVWPGDADSDGWVSIQDAIPLGMNYGLSGPARIVTGTQWLAHHGDSWFTHIVSTHDGKHADADGNGLIDLNDFVAVDKNYQSAHQMVPSQIPSAKSTGLELNLLTPFVEPGDWAVIEVSLGNELEQVEDVCAVHFETVIAPDLVDSASLSFQLLPDLFGDDNRLIQYTKSPADGKLDVAIMRTDREGVSGHGLLGEIRFIVEEDINGFRSQRNRRGSQIEVIKPATISSGGEGRTIPGDKLEFYQDFNQERMELEIFPNPTEDQVWLRAPEPITQITLLDLQGRIVKEMILERSLTNYKFDLGSQPDGLFILKVQSAEGSTFLGKVSKNASN